MGATCSCCGDARSVEVVTRTSLRVPKPLKPLTIRDDSAGRGLGWADEEARRLAAALEHATAQGALKALKKLWLHDNKIGDEGLRHLGDALARGAAPALKTLALIGNPASDAAKQAVKDALENRK